jgi:hypothetical protein
MILSFEKKEIKFIHKKSYMCAKTLVAHHGGCENIEC